MLGMFLTGLLRMAALAYLFAVSIKLEPASLMYMSPAAAPMMAFAAFGAARWLEKNFQKGIFQRHEARSCARKGVFIFYAPSKLFQFRHG